MSNLLALSDLRDPAAFLTGARIPLTHQLPMAAWQRYEWIADRLLARLCSDGAWVERVARIAPDWRLYFIDLSDPDVARWCDRKIATALGSDRPERLFLYVQINGYGAGKGWAIGSTSWTRNGECDESSHGDGVLDVPLLFDVPCDDAHLPAARAAILRALFGASNA